MPPPGGTVAQGNVDFDKQDSGEKRRLLDFLFSNCSRADGKLSATLKQRFDPISGTTTIDA